MRDGRAGRAGLAHLLSERLGRAPENVGRPGCEAFGARARGTRAVGGVRGRGGVLADEPEDAGARLGVADLVQAAREARDDLERGKDVRGERAVGERVLLLLQPDLDEGLEDEDGVGDDDVCRGMAMLRRCAEAGEETGTDRVCSE